MKSLIYLVFSLFFVNGDVNENSQNSFQSFKVYRVIPSNTNQSDFLYNLQNEMTDLDFWTDVKKAGFPVDIMVSPDMQEDFVKMMKDNNIESGKMIDDIPKY